MIDHFVNFNSRLNKAKVLYINYLFIRNIWLA